MLFHSTNRKIKNASLPEAILQGLAPDGGLFLPDSFPQFPRKFLNKLGAVSFRQIAGIGAKNFINEIPDRKLDSIIKEAFNFSVPLCHLRDQVYILELFHGPTMV